MFATLLILAVIRPMMLMILTRKEDLLLMMMVMVFYRMKIVMTAMLKSIHLSKKSVMALITPAVVKLMKVFWMYFMQIQMKMAMETQI